MVFRVSHDPAAGTAEIWLHVFVGNRIVGRIGPADCPELGAAVTSGEGVFAHLDLDGRSLRARALGFEGDRTPFGNGTVPVEVDATWSDPVTVGGNLAGREERIVAVTADVRVDGVSARIEGLGHQHVQVQDAPRFTVSFTYLSVRGETTGLIGVVAPRRQAGFGYRLGDPFETDRIEIDPPGPARRLRIGLGGAERLDGTLRATYRYAIPLGGTWRASSLVSGDLGAEPVTGIVNDLDLEAPREQPIRAG
jgi:hypothetical protein